MALADLLKNIGGGIQKAGSGLAGFVNFNPEMTWKDRLLGQQTNTLEPMNKFTQIPKVLADYTGSVSSGIQENPRRGGILRDVGEGFNENLRNRFTLDNFKQSQTSDGRKKGFAFKVGEGLGSAARIAKSPLGRAALTAGAIGAFGGSPLEMTTYGAQSGLLNQQSRMKNSLYRNALKNSYGYEEEDALNSLSGGGGSGYFSVKAPDGVVRKIPKSELQNAIKAGGVLL